jgi:Flp pilus assembly protein TadD
MLYYPSDPDIRAGLAWSLLKMGKRSDARKAFHEALESAPRSQLALDGLKILDG